MDAELTEGPRSLDEVRREIDEIDRGMHQLLMKRAELVVEVAAAKAEAARQSGEELGSALRPSREAQVLRALAERHDDLLPLKVVFRVWREIISAKTCLQGPFRAVVYTGSDSLQYWDLARNQYGASTPMEPVASAREVLRRVAEDRYALGVLPFPSGSQDADWWRHLGAKGPKVVAALPFLADDKGMSGWRALAVAQAPFEESGEDVSLFAIAAKEGGESAISRLVAKMDLSAEPLAVVREETGQVRMLVAVDGFVGEEDERLARLAAEPTLEHVYALGGYAKPLKPAAHPSRAV